MERYKTEGTRKHHRSSRDREAVLPGHTKLRLHDLFRDVEKEFEALYLENVQLKERIAALERASQSDADPSLFCAQLSLAGISEKDLKEDHDEKNVLKSFTKNKAIKTRHKLKAHTSKIVSSFKAPSLVCSLAKEFKGHRDGVWDIGVSKLSFPLIGTASADKTARIWGIDSGKCLAVYTGHTGSVNSISFHPTQDLVMTASGDGTAHVWQASILPESLGMSCVSSEESAESSEEDVLNGSHRPSASAPFLHTTRQPINTLTGHQGVVIGCAWLNEDLAVTAGWDRVANLYNVETGALIQTLAGHDSELTHVACHPTQRLVATSSVDTTFRLWDFRETIHSVSVFQGHTDSVSCAYFCRSDQIVSGSDDRSVKVWDLRNMRAPVTIFQTSAAVNKLAVSPSGWIAVPQDNRHVVIHDLNGHKLFRLPREPSKSHHRMVTAVCWGPEASGPGLSNQPQSSSSNEWRSMRPNLFTAAFDRLAFGWIVRAGAGKDDPIKVKDKSLKEKENIY